MSIQTQVTNGTVSIEDGNPAKTGDFDPKKKVRVEISFAVPEGEDAKTHLDAAATLASTKVSELLGRSKAPASAVVPPTAQAAPATSKPETAKPAEKPKPAKPAKVEKTKADLEKEMLAAASAPASEPAVAIDDDDPLGDLLGDTAPTPVTDKELSGAAIAKAEKMKSVAGWEPKKIRLLVEKFAGKAGSKFHEIPADKRHDFLKELDALK